MVASNFATVTLPLGNFATLPYLLLKQPSDLNYKKSEVMFSYASCQVWNSVPRFLREIDNVVLFKKQLKCYYFDIAFKGINDKS